MMIKKYKLKNGLTVIINKTKKHNTFIELITNVGSKDNSFKINNKIVTVPRGLAHFLEHYLIEQSIYGNMSEYFSHEYIDSNGSTSNNETRFYISLVSDYKEPFIKFLNMINNPIFSSKKIDLIKNPIIQEIKRSKDNNYKLFFKTIYNNLTNQEVFDITLGSEESINSINVSILKKFHKSFYRPDNQVLVITGNVGKDILKLIENIYNSFNFDKKNIERIEYNEVNKVVNKKSIICDKTVKEDLFEIIYKINISKYDNETKDRIDYYLCYLLDTNFNESSYLFNYLFDNKIINYSIKNGFEPDVIKDYFLVHLRFYTKESSKIIKLLKDYINTSNLDEKSFESWKKNVLINNIIRYETPINITNSYMGNVLLYNLYRYDDIDFLKSLNFKECIKLLNELDFSNNTIVINKVKK